MLRNWVKLEDDVRRSYDEGEIYVSHVDFIIERLLPLSTPLMRRLKEIPASNTANIQFRLLPLKLATRKKASLELNDNTSITSDRGLDLA